MSDREKILDAIRRQPIPETPHPGTDGPWIEYPNPLDKFQEMVGVVGGDTRIVSNRQQMSEQLTDLGFFQRDTKRWSGVKGLPGDWNVDLAQVDDPHDLRDLDLAVFSGEFGVAENGAIWLTDHNIPQRAAIFIAQHIAIALPSHQIVHNLHQAYQRISPPDRHFGCFVSGPSKTADIEQSLVIGAHGARSLTVFLVEDFAERHDA